MNPAEFVPLAQRISKTVEFGPAGVRSATSRAYYGAFLSVRGFLEQALSVPCRAGGISEHQLVQRYLINLQVPDGVELGHMLGTLQQARKEADYEMQNSAAENEQAAVLNVARAERILQKLQTCSKVSVQQQLKAGITQYRRLIKEV